MTEVTTACVLPCSPLCAAPVAECHDRHAGPELRGIHQPDACERERAALVEVILTGAAARGTLWEVANTLRLPLDGSFLVVAAETDLGHDPIPRAESALAVLDVRSVWRLDADLSLSPADIARRMRQQLADPSLWPNERLFFETYAQALQARAHTVDFLDDVREAAMCVISSGAVAKAKIRMAEGRE